MNVAFEIRNLLVEHLRSYFSSNDSVMDPDDIRGSYDMSGSPKSAYSAIVSVTDMGDHDGLIGRIIIDLQVKISLFSHLDEDLSGVNLDDLCSIIMGHLKTFNPVLSSGILRFIDSFSISQSSVIDSFRILDLTSSIIVQNTEV